MGEKKSFKPPIAVQNAAKRGLRLRRKAKKSNRGGLTSRQAGKQGIGSGVQRAANLASGGNVSLRTVKRMHAFFSRHKKNSKIDPGKTADTDRGFQAWLLWGGDPGAAWAKRIVEREMKVKKSSPFQNILKGKVYPIGTVRLHGRKYKRKTAHGWIEVPKRELREAKKKKSDKATVQKVKILGSGKRQAEGPGIPGAGAARAGAIEDLKAKYAKKYARVFSHDMDKKGLKSKVNQVKTEEGLETRVEFKGAFALVDFKGEVTLPQKQSEALGGQGSDVSKKFVEARKEYEKDP